jgi:hypothetical protein
MKHLVVDDGLENADWTKQSWDLPPYKSEEFNRQVPDLEAFKKTPVYKDAVKKGLIVNDRWADKGGGASQDRPRGRHLHVHLERKKK